MAEVGSSPIRSAGRGRALTAGQWVLGLTAEHVALRGAGGIPEAWPLGGTSLPLAQRQRALACHPVVRGAVATEVTAVVSGPHPPHIFFLKPKSPEVSRVGYIFSLAYQT